MLDWVKCCTFAGRFCTKLAGSMRKIWIILLLVPAMLMAQEVTLLKQRKFPKTVPAGNYSGITWMGGNRYAVANDKSPTTGFYQMAIDIDNTTGDILSVRLDTFLTCGQPTRDEEGICYMPQNQTVFVSGEKDQEIIEFDLQGQLTGRKLNIPEIFKTNYPNRGFEALTYQQKTHRFWTTSESTLRADGDKPTIDKKIKNRLSYCLVKLYVVNPSQQQPGEQLKKTLLTQFRTKVSLTRQNFANYEGICVGSKLADGRQLLILICDSQNQRRGILRDWFKTIILP